MAESLLSSSPEAPFHDNQEVFLDVDDSLKPDLTPLIESGFLTDDGQGGVQLSSLATYLLENSLKKHKRYGLRHN